MNLDIPEFSIYQSFEDYALYASSAPSKIFGILAQTAERVTLVGERAAPGRGINYIGMMTWRNALTEAPAPGSHGHSAGYHAYQMRTGIG